jgi:hypothetical protein
MKATESYYKKRIEIMESAVTKLTVERDLAREAVKRWELNADDVGRLEGESPASFLRRLARSAGDGEQFRQLVNQLMETNQSLAAQLERLTTTVYSNWKPREFKDGLTE